MSKKLILSNCNRALGAQLDYLFVIHWFRRGGAELETLLLIRALQKFHPKLKMGMILTLDAPAEWEDLLPRSVKRVHFGRMTSGMPQKQKRDLLFEVLSAQAPKIIHNVISETCWDVFVAYGEELAKRSTLLVSSFCATYPRKKPEAFVFSHLPRCKAPIHTIIVDNRKHAQEVLAKKKNANVEALRFPVHNAFAQPRRLSPSRRLNLLWAGRMDYQKRIDILYLVALLNPDHSFHAWGEFVTDRPNTFFDLSKLKRLPNVTLHEKYDRIEQIPLKKFDAFLYTSAWDGMPNVLIEAATKGLPIIAPDVGGVRELINEKTGYLVSHVNAVGEYSKALMRIAANPAQARQKAMNAQRFLRARHSRSQFESHFKKILKNAGL